MSDEWPRMEFDLEFDENTDAFQAQQMILDALKAQFEESGMTMTIEQWEILKTGQMNALIIFNQLVDKEIAKLKEEL